MSDGKINSDATEYPCLCGGTVSLKPPAVRTIHDTVFTTIVVQHRRPVMCAVCGAAYTTYVDSVSLSIVPVELPQPNKVIPAGVGEMN